MTINVRYHKPLMVSMITSHHASTVPFSGSEVDPMVVLLVHLTSGTQQCQNTKKTPRPSAGSYEINELINIYWGADGSLRVTTPTCTQQPTTRSWLGLGAWSSTGTYWRRVCWVLACPNRKACTQQASPRREHLLLEACQLLSSPA